MRNKVISRLWLAALVFYCLLVAGCSGGVGVGVNVGVPIGDHGYISVGSSNWF